MAEKLIMQFVTLSLFAFLMGFCFCDGFKLHVLRKLIWFSVFLAMCIYILKAKNELDLATILPVPILLAILLCAYEKRKLQ